jgi:hypothetical protein
MCGKRHRRQRQALPRLLRQALARPHALGIDLDGKRTIQLGLHGQGDRRQALPLRDRRQMLQTDPLAARLHPALVVTLARPGKAGLEQVVTRNR